MVSLVATPGPRPSLLQIWGPPENFAELQSSFPEVVTPQQLHGNGQKNHLTALLKLLKSNFQQNMEF